MTHTNKVALYAIARKTWKSHAVRVGALTGLGLLMTELWFWIFRRDELFRNFFFESTSSDQMMQTLDLDVLIDHPIRNFWYLHFQPPGFDLLRLILALPEAIFGSQPTSESLDLRIYLVHILMFGVMNAITFYWARIISHSFVLALTASLVWAAYREHCDGHVSRLNVSLIILGAGMYTPVVHVSQDPASFTRLGCMSGGYCVDAYSNEPSADSLSWDYRSRLLCCPTGNRYTHAKKIVRLVTCLHSADDCNSDQAICTLRDLFIHVE